MYQVKIDFEMFKHKYAKKYNANEEAYRFKVFKDNVEMIKKHNADNKYTYKLGMNLFGDMTH
jgi:hypothetical protein